LRVLVADDDCDTVSTLRLLLEQDGHEVRSVYDGAAVLDGAESFKPDVVLLDIGMPYFSGYDVARTLRRRYGKEPMLIAVTAWGRDTDRADAKAAGFDYHLPKPYSPDVLLALVQARARKPAPR
jgi:two-component system, sensor histidine kinase